MTTSSKIFYGTIGAALAAFIGYIAYKKSKSSTPLSTSDILSELLNNNANAPDIGTNAGSVIITPENTNTGSQTGNNSGNNSTTNSGKGDTIHDVFTTTPKSSFTFSPTSGNYPLKVTFKNDSKNATSYLWDFGDGVTSKDSNPVHTYSKEGAFVIKLKALNSKNDSDTYSSSIKVSKATVVTPISLPKASFTLSPTSGNIPLTVTLTNTSTGATSYSWDFGDGTTSGSFNPQKVFSKSGTFNIKLTATNSKGSNSFTKSITASAATTTDTSNKGGSTPSTLSLIHI